jgi:succinate dehydrogenase hydrophobic anchor subunit
MTIVMPKLGTYLRTRRDQTRARYEQDLINRLFAAAHGDTSILIAVAAHNGVGTQHIKPDTVLIKPMRTAIKAWLTHVTAR